VDRMTGRMWGSAGFSSDVWTGGHEVLDSGSLQQSFKTMYLSGGPYRHIMLLQIREYDDGPAKGFILTEDTDTLTGTLHAAELKVRDRPVWSYQQPTSPL